MARGCSVDFELKPVDGDCTVRIDESLDSEAEEIFDRAPWGRERELSKERLLGFERSLEAKGGDLSGGGMDLGVVVLTDLLFQDGSRFFDGADVVSDAGADQMILKPSVRAFDLALGLRGEGVEGLDAALF